MAATQSLNFVYTFEQLKVSKQCTSLNSVGLYRKFETYIVRNRQRLSHKLIMWRMNDYTSETTWSNPNLLTKFCSFDNRMAAIVG